MYMLRDHENEKKFTKMMQRRSPNTLVKPSEKVLKVRKTILKAGTHKNILGQGIGPQGLNLRATCKVHVARINETNHPDPNRVFEVGDFVYWACGKCAGKVDQGCDQCKQFINPEQDDDVKVEEVPLDEFKVLPEHHELIGKNIGPPCEGKVGLDLNNVHQIQAVGMTPNLLNPRLC